MTVTRREFVVAAGFAAAATRRTRTPSPTFRGRQVAIFGGGMGGLAAAHELAERGFSVTVFEPTAWGGKARSIPVPHTGVGGRANLPGEHGFRFFPGFYQSVPDTMRRIPVPGNADGVFDNLVNGSQELLIFPGGNQMYLTPSTDASGLMEGAKTLATGIGIAAGVPANQIEYFVRKLLVFLTSCDARRLGEWEQLGWWEFTNAAKFSKEYQTVFGSGLTKDLVAAKGTLASTRTVGLMAEAFVYATLAELSPSIQQQSGYGAADRLLDSPTNEAWDRPVGRLFEDPRRQLPTRLGGEPAAGVRWEDRGGHGDAYVWGARARERGRRLLHRRDAGREGARAVRQGRPRRGAGAGRARQAPGRLHERDPVLPEQAPVPVQVHGHVAFLGTPWALTSIDQGLFWKRDIAKQYGNGQVSDIYSVDISDFFTPGILYGKTAVDCTRQEIASEVWAQMKQQLNSGSEQILSDDMLESWFLDPAVAWPTNGGPAISREPLLINTAGSLADRPQSTTAIPNLFLASDYVQVNVDLATMEGANEAGRQAANAILQLAGSSAQPATLGKLWQPSELDSVFAIDAQRYKAGQPNLLDIIPASIPA